MVKSFEVTDLPGWYSKAAYRPCGPLPVDWAAVDTFGRFTGTGWKQTERKAQELAVLGPA
jgi:hypothetical protein